MKTKKIIFNTNLTKNDNNFIEIFISILGILFTILAIKTNNLFWGSLSLLGIFYLLTNKIKVDKK